MTRPEVHTYVLCVGNAYKMCAKYRHIKTSRVPDAHAFKTLAVARHHQWDDDDDNAQIGASIKWFTVRICFISLVYSV